MATEMICTRERKGDRTVSGEVTASLPEVFMRELRGRLSLVGEMGRRVTWDMDASEPSDGVMRGPCPFCRWRRAGKSTLVADDMMREWRCTECGRGGDVVDWIGMVEWISPLAGFREAAARAGIGMPEPEPRTPAGVTRRRKLLADANRVAADYFRFRLRDNCGLGARKWLAAQTEIDGQSMGERDIDWWGIGFAPDMEAGLVDRLRRLGFPDGIILAAGLAEVDAGDGVLRDRFRDMVTFEIREGGFHAQSMESAERARHIATPDTEIFSRERCLPNLGRVDTRPGMEREILVGRSGLDMTKLQYLGGPAVASIDHGLTVGQMERLWRATECIVPVVPNLPEALAGAFRTLDLALPLLTGERQMRFLPLSHRGSVSEFVQSVGKETAKDVLRVRCPLPDMLLLRERHGLDADRADHRARLYDRVQARLREIGDPKTQYGFLRDLDHYAIRVERRIRERSKGTVAG